MEGHNDRGQPISALESRTQDRCRGSSSGNLRGYLWSIGGPPALLAKPAGERLLCGFARSIVHIFPCRTTGDWSPMVSQSAQNSGSLHAPGFRCVDPDPGALLWPPYSLSVEPAGSDGRRTGHCGLGRLSAAAVGAYADGPCFRGMDVLRVAVPQNLAPARSPSRAGACASSEADSLCSDVYPCLCCNADRGCI